MILKDFKQFIGQSNVMDLAAAVVMGSAFSGVISSLVNDILNPFLALFAGKANFTDLSIKIGSATLRYGAFIQAILHFLIISFILFITVRYVHRLSKKIADNIIDPLDKTLDQKIIDPLEKTLFKDQQVKDDKKEDIPSVTIKKDDVMAAFQAEMKKRDQKRH